MRSTRLSTRPHLMVSDFSDAWRPTFERVRALRPTAPERVAWSVVLRRAAHRVGVAPVEPTCPICVGRLVAALPGGSAALLVGYEQALRDVAVAKRALRTTQCVDGLRAEAA